MRLTPWLSLFTQTNAQKTARSIKARRPRTVAVDRPETLEDRALLTLLAVYVDNPGDFQITADQGAIGVLDAGDTVTWHGATDVTGLVYGQRAFGTIQSAIDTAATNATVNVAAGTYDEFINVNKSLTLNGAQAGVSVDGRTYDGAGETILHPLGTITQVAGQRGVILVGAANVTIDGFSVTKNGQAGYGIAQYNTNSGYTVQNNIVHGFTGTIGINVAAHSTGFLIHGNRVEDGGSGAYYSAGSQGTVDGNTFKDLEDGVVIVEGGNTTTPGGVTITDNKFDNLSGFGLQVAGTQTADNFEVDGNEFTDTPNQINNTLGTPIEFTDSTVDGVSDVTTITGTDGIDNFYIRKESDSGPTQYSNDGLTWTDIDLGTGPLVFNGGSGSDNFFIDLRFGFIPAGGLIINGGDPTSAPGDKLYFGYVADSVVYTPTAGSTDSGHILYGTAGNVDFTGLEPVDFSYITASPFTLVLPSANNDVTISDGLLSIVPLPAIVLSGTSGGFAFESAHVTGASSITVDTTSVAGTDTVTINALNGATTSNAALTVDLGSESGDVINVDGAVTFTGATTLNGKTINLNANITGSVTGSVATTVNVGTPGQLADAVSVAASVATINIAGGNYTEGLNTSGKSLTISPNGTSTVSLVGGASDLTLDGNDTLQIQFVNGSFDSLDVGGTVTLGGATLSGSFTGVVPPVGTEFVIIDNGSSSDVSGTFAGLPEDSIVVWGSVRFVVSYEGGDGNDVTLTVAPPPVTVTLTNGNLVVSGTGYDDRFVFQVSGTNMVTLIGVDGTSFGGNVGNGVSVGPFKVTGTVTINTGNGDDVVGLNGSGANALLNGGKVSIDLGAGDDVLVQGTPSGVGVESPLRITNSLSIVGGLGSDLIYLGLGDTPTDFIVGGLTIDNGTDNGSASQVIQFGGVTVNGNTTLTNSGTADQVIISGQGDTNDVFNGNVTVVQSNPANVGGYLAILVDAAVSGNLSIKNGNTASVTLTQVIETTVAGTATIVNGNAAGINNAFILNSSIGGNATVTNGSGGVNNFINVFGSAFGGSSAFTNGASVTFNQIILSGGLSTYAGPVSATNNSATGNNFIIVDQASMNGGATLANKLDGAQTNLIQVSNASVVGNLAISNAASTLANTVIASVLATSGSKKGDVNIANGASATTNVSISASTIGGDVTIRNQATSGQRTTNMDGTSVGGKSGFSLFNVDGGDSVTTLGAGVPFIVTNAVKIQDGTGDAVLDVRNVVLGSLNFQDLGNGQNTLDLGGDTGGNAVVVGVTRITTGEANDIIRIGTAGSANLNDSVFITLSAGDDAMIIGDNATSTAFGTASKFQFDGGQGIDSFMASMISLPNYQVPLPGKKLKNKITNFESYDEYQQP